MSYDPYTFGNKPCDIILADILSSQSKFVSSKASRRFKRFQTRLNHLCFIPDQASRRHCALLVYKDALRALDKTQHSMPPKVFSYLRLCLITEFREFWRFINGL